MLFDRLVDLYVTPSLVIPEKAEYMGLKGFFHKKPEKHPYTRISGLELLSI